MATPKTLPPRFDKDGYFMSWETGSYTSESGAEVMFIRPGTLQCCRRMFPDEAKQPCGECHLQPGETCDICGAKSPEAQSTR